MPFGVFSEVNSHSRNQATRRDLRVFGLMLGCIALLVAAILHWKQVCGVAYVAGLGLVLVGAAVFFPHRLHGLYAAWMCLGVALGWLSTRIILLTLYYLVCTPIGGIARLFGKRFLTVGKDARMDSYWIRRSTKPKSKEEYERQF